MRTTKIFFSLTLILALSFSVSAQKKINWKTWEEALAANEKEPRKFFVDVYTDWCGYCKKMDASTFRKPYIVDYINKNYYAIKFNAETKEDITINDKVYKFVDRGKRGFHELAYSITKGALSYPTLVFLDEKTTVIQPIKGFRDADELELMMTYFAGDFHKTTPWKRYTESYNRANNKHIRTVNGGIK